MISTATTSANFALTAKFGFEVIQRVIFNPGNYVPQILIFSVVIIAAVAGICYGIKKVYERCFPEG
ncbi:MAG: hypothetical protein H7A36_01220 [Chlamydiales bacterium]|nr:hypothetical protein [Chlamydiales bacterium]